MISYQSFLKYGHFILSDQESQLYANCRSMSTAIRTGMYSLTYDCCVLQCARRAEVYACTMWEGSWWRSTWASPLLTSSSPEGNRRTVIILILSFSISILPYPHFSLSCTFFSHLNIFSHLQIFLYFFLTLYFSFSPIFICLLFVSNMYTHSQYHRWSVSYQGF